MPITMVRNGKRLGEITRYDEMKSPDGQETWVTYWTTAPLESGEVYELHFDDGRFRRVRVIIPGPSAGIQLPPDSWGARGSAQVIED